jgi:aminoglycoside phosphotransferase (APT) family kinase protein
MTGMALVVERDLDAIAGGITPWLCARRGLDEVRIIGCTRPSEGLSSETVVLDAVGTRGGAPWSESLVLRLPPSAEGTFESYDLSQQACTQTAVSAAGIPTAVPVEFESDTAWLDAPFLVMPTIDGHIPGDVTLLDDWIISASSEAQADLHGHFLEMLAAIHRVDWRRDGLDEVVPARDLGAELAHWSAYLDWYADGEPIVPALVDALEWCRNHRPDDEPRPSLLWGDVRLGNVIFDGDRRAVAVLDWEMATIGPAEHDLAWFLGLEAMQSELFGRTVPGFPPRDEAVAHYEAHLGRPVRDLDWYEIFALVRSTAIMTRIALLHLRAGRTPVLPIADNPVLDVLRRRIETASRGGS